MHTVENNSKETAILVGIAHDDIRRWEIEEHIEELALLADTAGAEVLESVIQEKERIDPAYFLGRGKAERISGLAKSSKADLLIFDDDLSPAQIRNWERLSDVKILDRSGLILDIFARRAKSREAKTQVELAQLNYLLPRLTRQWTHLSRQVGGIGTRGPGETQLEVDRRLIRKRIGKLKKDLSKIQNQRHVQRQSRSDTFKIALVGYTNAGKSTLLNALSEANAFVEDRLFATLDPTVRRFELEKKFETLLIDTVGFIRKLPHHLVASFMSTMEETAEADLLLHIVDISSHSFHEQIKVVNAVLKDLNVSGKPTIFVFNKVDELENKGVINALRNEFSPAVFISARKGLFLNDLKEEVLNSLQSLVRVLDLRIDINSQQFISKIYSMVHVLDRKYEEDSIRMKVRTTKENANLIKRLMQEELNGEDNLNEFFEISSSWSEVK